MNEKLNMKHSPVANPNSLLQCQKGVRSMGMPIHLYPFSTEQANY